MVKGLIVREVLRGPRSAVGGIPESPFFSSERGKLTEEKGGASEEGLRPAEGTPGLRRSGREGGAAGPAEGYDPTLPPARGQLLANERASSA